jgi:phosphoribosylanthranilate isomerase
VARVKICGITNVDDALLAAECGADAIGFVFAESPRKIDVAEAAEIAGSVPPFIARVGVFVNAPQKTVTEALTSFLDCVQLHGEESVSVCESLAKRHGSNRIIKVFRVREMADLGVLDEYVGVAGMFHLDTRVPDAAGGTGRTFDWRVAVEAKRWGKPIVLSGGLTPDNVAEAVAQVKPYAVDASSGVERAPGKKDPEKVRNFVKRAKQVVTG